MQDFFLKFADEAEANSMLYTVTPEVLDAEGNVIQEAYTQPNYRNIDVIGVLMNNTDPENPAVIPGWHVNVRSDEAIPELEPFMVTPEPTTPVRVWA